MLTATPEAQAMSRASSTASARPPPSRRGSPPAQHGSDAFGLIGQRRVERSYLGSGWPPVDPEPRWPLRIGSRPEHQTELVEGRVAVAARDVSAQRAQQSRQQGRPQQRFGLGERVGEAQGDPAGIVGRQEQGVEALVGDERIAQRLHEAARGEYRPEPSAEPLARREPAPGPGLR
jgi:capsular polysaccharide biosynthesis protein